MVFSTSSRLLAEAEASQKLSDVSIATISTEISSDPVEDFPNDSETSGKVRWTSNSVSRDQS